MLKKVSPFLLTAIFLFGLSAMSSAQRLELNGAYAHASGDLGLDGFNVGAAWWFSPRVSVAGEFDSLFDTSKVGAFELTNIGLVSVKSDMQNYLVGPRVFFPRVWKRYPQITPFGELQFGASHLHTTLHQTSLPDQSSGDQAFTWMFGGGADYLIRPHWAARVKVDMLRTHFLDEGQSRLRFTMGLVYTFGTRK